MIFFRLVLWFIVVCFLFVFEPLSVFCGEKSDRPDKGIDAEFTVEGEPDLTQDMETQLYWVVYEALSNVLKHAKAKHVSLNFRFSGRNAAVILKDDGVGFDPTTYQYSHSGGLKNIVERVQGFGGKITIDSDPGAGTNIKIEYKQ